MISAKRLVADRIEVPRQALVDALEVGARVGADRQSVLAQQRRDHPGRGSLAVGPGDVNDGIRLLGIAEYADELAHLLEREAVDMARGGFEVDVLVEVRERCRW